DAASPAPDARADAATPAPDAEPADAAEDAGVSEPDAAVEVPPLTWTPHVRGTFNDWGVSAPMTFAGQGRYRATSSISAGEHMFKIADDRWTLTTIYSTDARNHVEIPLDTPMPLVIATGYNNDAVLQIPAEGQYTFTLDVTLEGATPSLVLTVTAGAPMPIEYPDDSAIEHFTAAPYAAVPLAEGTARVLGAEDLFDVMAIDVPPGEEVQFVLGDNLDGYYEGWTHAYTSASRYRMRSGYVFAYFASLADGVLADRTDGSIGTSIHPWGVRTEYSNGISDALVMHTHRRAISLLVHSPTPAVLSIVPRLNLVRSSTDTFRRVGDVMVYAVERRLQQPGTPGYVAIAGDRDHSATGVDLDAAPELGAIVGITADAVKPIFTTAAPETDFRVTLAFGATAEEAAAAALELAGRDAVAEEKNAVWQRLVRGWLWTNDVEYDRALAWASFSAGTMVVEELGQGIWAGLPWFKNNWGRDTFIALPGTLLVHGRFEEAKAVIRNFATLQNTTVGDTNYGRVPNVVNSLTDRNYNTTDGTPWLVREIAEVLRYTGDTAFAAEMYPVVERYLTGAITHWVDADGLLTHGDTATWMDAAFGSSEPLHAWSARGNRAVEIQALWYVALRAGAELATAEGDTANAAAWTTLADQVRERFRARFWDATSEVMADRVRADGSRDVKLRPNQLMVVSIPFAEDRLVDDAIEAAIVRNATNGLLYRHGIASLDQTHPYFHPFHDRQAGWEKDAAYHNGTVWGWNAGFTVTALTRFGRADHAYEVTKNLATQILGLGTRGSMSELLDAHPTATGALTPSGTFSQAWSVAEYARNGWQDYLGFRPNVPAQALVLSPSIPSSWTTFEADAPFGTSATLSISYARTNGRETWVLAHDHPAMMTLSLRVPVGGARWALQVPLAQGTPRTIVVDTTAADPTITVDGQATTATIDQPSQDGVLGALQFVEPNVGATFPVQQQSNYLRGVIERGEFE
ncbi:amylo-alpha-1,6-glucosidase, partial [Myxococcota bacterium]|nr:amylo-alpha-1,6-glucosidase [Myxococcota bacterium]